MLDVVRAVVQLAEHPQAVGQVLNIGSREEISITELAEMVIRLTGSQSSICYVPYDKAYTPGFEDMQRRVPDLSKIQRFIGYQPVYTLTQTLARVIEFEKMNPLADEHEN